MNLKKHVEEDEESEEGFRRMMKTTKKVKFTICKGRSSQTHEEES